MKRIGKPSYLIESELAMEETILKFRKMELEKIKTSESFCSIIKMYNEMNRCLSEQILKFNETKKNFTVKQLSLSIESDNRSTLPNIFSVQTHSTGKHSKSQQPPSVKTGENESKRLTEQLNAAFMNEMKEIASHVKLPGPPITQIENGTMKPVKGKTPKKIKVPTETKETKEKKEKKEKKSRAEQEMEKQYQRSIKLNADSFRG